MRDLLLMSIVVVAMLATLRRPWLGIILWVWVSLMNPHRYTYGFAYSAPVAAMAALGVLLGLLLSKERESPFKGTPVTVFVAFTVWMTVSWLAGIDVKGDYEQWEKVMKINLMIIMALVLLRSKEHIFVLAWVMTLSIALLGAKGGVFTILTGGGNKVWGPDGSFVSGNNEFAVAVIMTIPLLRFMQLQARNRFLALLLGAMMLFCAAAALGSHSRGALLAIGGMALLLWYRGSNRFRNGVLFIVVGALLIGFMPSEWTERMSTIDNYGEDKSALGRFSAWWVSWRIALNYPAGVGFSISRPELFIAYSPYPELGTPVAHSIYFQVLGHHGFIGFLLFMGVWLATWVVASRTRREAKGIPEAAWCSDLAGMCQVSMMGYLFGGAFLSLAYYDFPYYVMVLVCLNHVWLKRRAWVSEPAESGFWRSLIGITPPLPARRPLPPGEPGWPSGPQRP